MRLSLKHIFILAFFLLSTQSFAYTQDYVSAFKPVQSSGDVLQFNSNIKKDIFQIRSMMNLKEKKIIGLMEESDGIKSQQRIPAEI